MPRRHVAVLTALLAIAAMVVPTSAAEASRTSDSSGATGAVGATGATRITTSGLAVTAEPAAGTVGVTSAVVYPIGDGVMSVVAEVKNNTTLRRVGVTVRVRFLDASDQDLGVTYTDTIRVQRLAYGARSPFWIDLTPPEGTETLVVDIGSSGSTTTARAAGALVIEPTGSYVEGDARIWTATLTNPNTFAISGATAHITTFDAGGTIVDAWPSAAVDLEAGASADIEIPLFDDPEAVRADFIAEATRTGTSAYVTSWNNFFDDLGNSTFRDDVEWLAEQRITTGCAPGRYCPTANVTRAQMALFLDRALGLPPTDTDYFTDDDGVTGEAAINRLAASGITGGCGGTNYCPTAGVKRDQMASFLARAMGITGVSAPDAFTDDTGNTHEGNINRIAQAGITGGCGGTKYCPSSFVTRGQMAAFLYRSFSD